MNQQIKAGWVTSNRPLELPSSAIRIPIHFSLPLCFSILVNSQPVKKSVLREEPLFQLAAPACDVDSLPDLTGNLEENRWLLSETMFNAHKLTTLLAAFDQEKKKRRRTFRLKKRFH
jgi:hypothetical protein